MEPPPERGATRLSQAGHPPELVRTPGPAPEELRGKQGLQHAAAARAVQVGYSAQTKTHKSHPHRTEKVEDEQVDHLRLLLHALVGGVGHDGDRALGAEQRAQPLRVGLGRREPVLVANRPSPLLAAGESSAKPQRKEENQRVVAGVSADP